MSTTNLKSVIRDGIMYQTGNGTPNHESVKNSHYTDIDTGSVYNWSTGTTWLESTEYRSYWDPGDGIISVMLPNGSYYRLDAVSGATTGSTEVPAYLVIVNENYNYSNGVKLDHIKTYYNAYTIVTGSTTFIVNTGTSIIGGGAVLPIVGNGVSTPTISGATLDSNYDPFIITNGIVNNLVFYRDSTGIHYTIRNA